MLSIVGLIPTVLSFLTGLSGTVGKVSDNIKELEIAKEKTKSDKELKEIDAQILALHDQKDVIIANAGNRLYQVLGFILFLGPAIYTFKYYAIDKAFGGLAGCSGEAGGILPYCYPFRTDALSPEMAVVLTAALGMFALQTTFKRN